MTELDILSDSVRQRIAADPRIRRIKKKIADGTAALTDTAEYSIICGEISGRRLSDRVSKLKDRSGACERILRDRYSDITEMFSAVQRQSDEAVGLHIAPRTAPFPEERVQQLARSLEDRTVSDETIKRRAESGTANITAAMHDDMVKANAQLRSDAGLKCCLVRETSGEVCKWCAALAGRYPYEVGEYPDDIFRRHDNCTCTVTYECGRQRQNVWTKRIWEVPDKDAGAKKPVVLSKEQAGNLQQEKLAAFHFSGVDNSGGSGIIKSIDVDDYELVTYGKGIQPEVSNMILDTMKQCEKDGGFIISDISTYVVANSSHGTPVLQIEPLPNGLLRLNVNAAYLSGKSLEEVNKAFFETPTTVVNSLKEAVIHESGHAISIKGKTAAEVKKLYHELKNAGMPGVSKIALEDGAECLAELEVLRHRGIKVSKELADFYNKYMGRDY